ncbi:MAG: PAS domain-containing protein [Alphaproteobacteria bacterium]|nr:PAS domain-containing protein [Alphaproteobacteria bacterium]
MPSPYSWMDGDALVLDIKSPVLQRLHRDWEARRRGRLMPARADFDPLDLKYVLGNLSLVDVRRDPLRFRFRLHATKVVERVGFELTGKDVEAIADPHYRKLVRDHYTAVVERRRPVLEFRDRVMTDNVCLHCEVLALPLGNDGETVDRIMSAFVWC